MSKAKTRRRNSRKAKPKTYKVWLGCTEADLQPAVVYTTTLLEELRIWRRAIEQCDYLDYQLTATANDKPVVLPGDRPLAEIMDCDDASVTWEASQRDEFIVYELRDEAGHLVDRDVCLFAAIKHMLSLYVSSDPMGGYVIRERKAVIPSVVSYSVWFIDDDGELLEEYHSGLSLEDARERVQMTADTDEYFKEAAAQAGRERRTPLRILRHEEYVSVVEDYGTEKGGA